MFFHPELVGPLPDGKHFLSPSGATTYGNSVAHQLQPVCLLNTGA
jgi:hypothetical protein